ncbi:hypothetical protein [Ktedonobacter robiniae]|uniref:Imm33-like domain-containing protein n=1 Tax=Ktedonobacter robiniae TaxID=2778365 RepID=A0ABQ3UXI7_9CHLR|nr:hypothetical protein [Ktedonobacter robiniae]GHO57406.1 hypothetical protein KSB_58810 [Ktedonobacter robiniae]
MHIYFHNAEDQQRWAYTEGLSDLGQREIAVLAPCSDDDLRNRLLLNLLEFIASYIKSQPKRILPGQTFRYGWVMLRFVSDEKNISGAGSDALLIEEHESHFALEDVPFVPGVIRAMELIQIQHKAMQRNQVTGDVQYPSSTHFALICSRVTPEAIQQLRPLSAQRLWEPEGQHSGWFFSCCDQSHDHDNPDELHRGHLLHLVKGLPAFFPYIAMPVGAALLFEENKVVIFPPGEEQGFVDPEAPLTTLPS